MFRSMNVSTRAAASFSVIALMLLFVGCFSLFQVQALRETEQVIETNWLAGVRDTGRLRGDVLELRLTVARSLIPSDDGSASSASSELVGAGRISKSNWGRIWAHRSSTSMSGSSCGAFRVRSIATASRSIACWRR